MRRIRLAFLMLVATASLCGLAAAAPAENVVSLNARSTVLKSDEYADGVFGEISSGAAGEYVAVRGKECGVPGGGFLRGIGGATTTAGGAWEASVFIRTATTLRAEWNGVQSAPVVVQRRAFVTLTKERKGFRVLVSSEIGSVDGKRVRVERLAPAGWRLLQMVTVRSSISPGAADKTKLKFAVPKGTALRAVLPLAQARPCYLAGYSKIVRT